MRITIRGTLPGLNEYINAERTSRYKGAAMKKQAEHVVILSAKSQLRGWKPKGPVFIGYLWVEKDRRRDKDNISGFGRKVIQDALIKANVLKNDGWREIDSYQDWFAVNGKNPRIEILIVEKGRIMEELPSWVRSLRLESDFLNQLVFNNQNKAKQKVLRSETK